MSGYSRYFLQKGAPRRTSLKDISKVYYNFLNASEWHCNLGLATFGPCLYSRRTRRNGRSSCVGKSKKSTKISRWGWSITDQPHWRWSEHFRNTQNIVIQKLYFFHLQLYFQALYLNCSWNGSSKSYFRRQFFSNKCSWQEYTVQCLKLRPFGSGPGRVDLVTDFFRDGPAWVKNFSGPTRPENFSGPGRFSKKNFHVKSPLNLWKAH